MQALGKNVLLKKVEGEQQIGSILLPGQQNQNRGEIVSVGNDVPAGLFAVGDHVIYNGGKHVAVDGKTFIASAYEDLLVKVKDAGNVS